MNPPNQSSRLLESAFATHWAITPEALDAMATIYHLASIRPEALSEEALNQVMQDNSELGHSLHMTSLDRLEALQTVKGTQLEGTRHGKIYENGIAVIDLIGPIFPRAGLMTMSSGVSVAQFTQDFVRAEAHPDVRGIIINIDSPGGDVRGIGDSAKVINAVTRKSKKPIKVFASGYMASAAYYLGSAVGPGNIVASESAIVGSIGVVMTVGKKGKDEIEITSSVSPNKRPDPSTEEGRTVFQIQVDDLAEIFVSDVLKYRGVTRDKVLADYGQGASVIAPRALKKGLVDKIGTLSQVVDEMASGTNKPGRTHYQLSADSQVSALLEFNSEELDNMGLKDIMNRFRSSDEPITSEPTPITGASAEESDEDNLATAGAPVEGQAGDDTAVGLEAAVEETTREEYEARFSDGAELFATQLVVGNRIFPANAVHAASGLMNAKIDDAMFGGQVVYADAKGNLANGSREEAIRALFESMPGHTLTQKAIEGIKDGSIEARVLTEAPKDTVSDGPITPERKLELLKLTDQGQAALSVSK